MINDRYLTAAFMAIGLESSINKPLDVFGKSVLLQHWDGGHDYLVRELLEYADYVHELGDAGIAVLGRCPGVFAYEVAEELGARFGQKVLAGPGAGSTPDPAEVCAEARNLAFDFFAARRWDNQPWNAVQMDAALKKVPTPQQRRTAAIGSEP